MHTLTELQSILKETFEKEAFCKTPENLYAPIDYTLADGGKRIRPMFVLLSCELFKGRIDNILSAAVGLEVFHNFTLLHDDIMDQSLIRRGKETVYRKWDTNTAILSGDTMFALAYTYFLKKEYTNQLAILKLFTQTAIEVCEGQQYDMDFEKKEEVSLNDYLKMIRLKTAVLLAAALKIGALSANASEEQCNKIYEFGINIGLAFQLQDDFLDCYGDTKTFGKKTGTDIVDKKKTFLFIKSLELATKEQKERLISLMEKEMDAETKVYEVKKIYEQLDIESETLKHIEIYFQKALQLIDTLNVDENAKKTLKEFTQTLLGRKS